MKVELTEKEIRGLGNDRGLRRRLWKFIALGVFLFGGIALVDYLEPESLNVWLQVVCMLPIVIPFIYMWFRLTKAAEKEGKALLKQLKEKEKEELDWWLK